MAYFFSITDVDGRNHILNSDHVIRLSPSQEDGQWIVHATNCSMVVDDEVAAQFSDNDHHAILEEIKDRLTDLMGVLGETE